MYGFTAEKVDSAIIPTDACQLFVVFFLPTLSHALAVFLHPVNLSGPKYKDHLYDILVYKTILIFRVRVGATQQNIDAIRILAIFETLRKSRT